MKYTVRINGRSLVVEIEDLNVRPVIAHVEGKRFEVIPESNSITIESKSDEQKETKVVKFVGLQKNESNPNNNEVTAPLPGTAIEVFIEAGDTIEAGQVIAIIEAMKMKNSIRSTRAGKIAEVLVRAGQAVAHKQALVRFE